VDLFDKVLYRTDEETTMSNITYLPSGLGAVKAAIKGLARKKQDWNIDILENEKGKQVIFEDEFSIFVPHQYWNDFSLLFDNCLDSSQVGLGRYLMEAMEEDLGELREEIRPALTRMYNDDVFRKLDYAIKQWRSRFGVKDYQRTDTLVRFEDKLRDIQKLVTKVFDVYGEDRGNLELLLEAIRNSEPLNSFQIFRQRDFLYGTRMYSRYGGVPLIFEGTIDMSHMMAQSILVEDQATLDDIEGSREIKVVKNMVYPVGDTFSVRFFGELQDATQGPMEGGPGEEEYEKDLEGEEGPHRQRMVPRGER
jgi:hypothetical protein